MKRLLIILALVLVLVPGSALAKGVTLLAGLQSVSFGGDIGEYYDVPPGPGLGILAHLDLGFPLDVRFGQRKTDERHTGRNVKYQWIEVGPRFRFGQEDASIRPDFFVGAGTYDLDIGSISFDKATGAYAGFGIEQATSSKFTGRLEVKSAYWRSDTYNTDGATLNISLLFGYQF